MDKKEIKELQTQMLNLTEKFGINEFILFFSTNDTDTYSRKNLRVTYSCTDTFRDIIFRTWKHNRQVNGIKDD